MEESLIDEFLYHYQKMFDFYSEAAKICKSLCKQELQKHNIKAIVTERAKNPTRLREKILKRDIKKKYNTTKEIEKDIVDLSGVRIALYFPHDQKKIEEIITKNFNVIKVKKFPTESAMQNCNSVYVKKFSGYSAIHYQVQLKKDDLLKNKQRYANGNSIEIQVASVLMHAWSEVEHDLVYKSMNGELSENELAILDELNGLILAGEIALERLQKAMIFRENK